MMQLVPRFKVTAKLPGTTPDTVFWVYGNSIANVLSMVSQMAFAANGLVQPKSITVEEEDAPRQEGVSYS